MTVVSLPPLATLRTSADARAAAKKAYDALPQFSRHYATYSLLLEYAQNADAMAKAKALRARKSVSE